MAIEFRHTLLTHKASIEEVLRERSLALVCYIEGTFTILHGRETFFDEPTPVLELGAHLFRWRHLHGADRDFAYTSMEHDEPILTFTNTNGQYWILDSIWKRSETMKVEREELLVVTARFLTDLEDGIHKQYGLNIVDFAERVPY